MGICVRPASELPKKKTGTSSGEDGPKARGRTVEVKDCQMDKMHRPSIGMENAKEP